MFIAKCVCRRCPLFLALVGAAFFLAPYGAIARAQGMPVQTSINNSADQKTLAGWIGSLQFQNPALPSFGAIQMDRGPGYRAPDGTAYFRVNPYDANLSVLGLLLSDAPNSKQIAEHWIKWYLTHIDAEDKTGAEAHISFVRGRVFPNGPGDPGFPPPFSVSDAGWLLTTLHCVSPMKDSGP